MAGSQGKIGTRDTTGDGNYDNNLDCAWTLLAPSNKVVKLSFESFHLESNYDCNYDYVEVGYHCINIIIINNNIYGYVTICGLFVRCYYIMS